MACAVCRMAVDGFQHTLNEALGDRAGARGEKWIEVMHRGKRFLVLVTFQIQASCQEIEANTKVECEQRMVVTG